MKWPPKPKIDKLPDWWIRVHRGKTLNDTPTEDELMVSEYIFYHHPPRSDTYLTIDGMYHARLVKEVRRLRKLLLEMIEAEEEEENSE